MSKRAGNEVIETEPVASGAVTYPRPMGVCEAGDPAEVPLVVLDGGGTGRFFPELSIDLIDESPMNPRKRYDPDGMVQLTESVRQKGVLTPLLVRPVAGGRFELAAGHRRRRAAQVAGLAAVPALARPMTDVELLEVLVIENDQREDVHPLEEAEGYQALLSKPGYDVARIAGRVGRSVKYVYDRLKLLQLIPEAQELFLENRFTPGHAILLARLDAKNQEKAIDPRDGGLWKSEVSFDWTDADDAAADDDPYHGHKPASVRELEYWINRNVKADLDAIDPVLFPETAALVSRAAEEGEKVVPIMRLDQTPAAVRGEGKFLTEKSWRRADGLEGSKTCSLSELGMIAIGPGRYEAFAICRKKDRCTVHWKEEIKEREARQRAAERATKSGKDPDQAERETHAEQEKRRAELRAQEEALEARWKKATPAMIQALAAAVLKAPMKPNGLLAQLLLRKVRLAGTASAAVPVGKTIEGLVRHLAFDAAMEHSGKPWDWGRKEFARQLRAFGIDAQKILDQAAPAEKPKPAVQTSAKPAGKKRARR